MLQIHGGRRSLHLGTKEMTRLHGGTTLRLVLGRIRFAQSQERETECETCVSIFKLRGFSSSGRIMTVLSSGDSASLAFPPDSDVKVSAEPDLIRNNDYVVVLSSCLSQFFFQIQ